MAPKQLLQLAETMARRQANVPPPPALKPGEPADAKPVAKTGNGPHYTAEALLLHVEVLREQERHADAVVLAEACGHGAFPLAADLRSLLVSLQVLSAAIRSQCGYIR